MNTFKATIMIFIMGLFLMAGNAQAAGPEDLDVTITTMDADDHAADVANEIQMPKEMEDSKDDHDGQGQAEDDDHHGPEAYDSHDAHEDLEENEAEDSHDGAEAAHEDSTEEMDSSSTDSKDSTDMMK